MNIKIKFIGLGLNDKYQARVKVYDYNNCLIFDNNSYNGYIVVNVMPNKLYKVVATFYNDIIITNIYSNKSIYYLVFNHAKYIPFVTLLLKDYYYNLPIEEGELILWQRQ